MKTLVILFILPFMFMGFKPLSNSSSISIHSKDARKLAEHYRQRVLRGESMSSLAKLYSEDPGSAANGGQYDGIIRGQMVSEFENVAFNLKPQEISDVFETQYGFHFIQLISRKGEVLSLRHLLITKD